MCRAFVKESDSEWLGDVEPNMMALERYLTRDNGGVKVFEVRAELDAEAGREVHVMSNESRYALDDDRRWYAV